MDHALRRTIATHHLFDGLAGRTLVVGVSGGPDSLALLHWLRAHAGRWGVALHAAHLDHGSRGAASAADAAWVAAICAAWGITATVRAADVPAWAAVRRLSPEDAARRVRYAFLWGVAAAVGAPAVAVAHNADDQVETVLLRLLRSTGPQGLAGMRPRRVLPPPASDTAHLLADWGLRAAGPPVALLRPLLATWRAAIEAYCAQQGLDPRRDASNLDPAYARNRVRQEVIPLLEQAQPGVRRRIWRLAGQMAAQNVALDRQLAAAWPTLTQGDTRLDLAALARLPRAVQERALRRFYQAGPGGGTGLTRAHLAAALRLAGPQGAPGRWVQWPGGVALVREYGALARRTFDSQTGAFDLAADAPRYPLLLTPGTYPLSEDTGSGLGPWRITLRRLAAAAYAQERATGPLVPDPWRAAFDYGALAAGAPEDSLPLVLRPRQPGERMHPLGLGGRSRRLQDVLSEARIPRRLRDHLALLALPQGAVLWVPGPGGRQSEYAKVTPATETVLIVTFAREESLVSSHQLSEEKLTTDH